ISNYAVMGYQCRHNAGYWEGEDYLGFGPSATSTLDDHRWTNPADQNKWKENIVTGHVGGEEEVLTPLIKVLEMIMLRLRTSKGLQLAAYQQMTGHDFLQDHKRLVQAMHEKSLIRIRKGYLRLTRSGMIVSNAILSNLFEHTKNVLQGVEIKAPKKELLGVKKDSVQPVLWPKI
ncbi:MAG: coproporphyrinogen III oxidase, partial [Desulfovibrio sp.]|nr:coproporphyrinogen III oxidase [Desulfovibrio sp.]